VRRSIVSAAALGIGLIACVTIGTTQAGARQPKLATVHCLGYQYSNEIWYPPLENQSGDSWTFSACSDIAATGGSGTGVLLNQTALGTTVLITWSTGGTTTIFLDPPGSSVNGTLGCIHRTLGFKFLQTGAVISDSTGLIKLRSFASQMCGYRFFSPQFYGVVYANKKMTFSF
jgi:hypothetical protein